ncbi:hypothetical protein KL86DES1_20575 [uncultured Desulfovibrio sp.]|jgi:hypothetical protein|uniref:Uncharacterized protein n=1 Tax=uncultured Desulfovibrio sp. TaxID=167968 RepID=A0A212L4E2_9BACT|nr:hypothetical protein KL86DES1_20575 [uncultured Desulfovibrio sp.]VZH33478.1 conserved protein of unknown function [Desulfovibrio sp. 86]
MFVIIHFEHCHLNRPDIAETGAPQGDTRGLPALCSDASGGTGGFNA